MKITVSRHIFGSVRGYTTLAKSEDLSPEEIADLEIFSFGQTNESTYMNSLETEPAYISRPLCSGRWAVTRVFRGKPDEHNRTTLLFVSAVITIEDWVYLLKCDVNELLYYRDLWQWDGKEKLEPIEVAVEGGREAADAEIRSRVLCLVAAVEKYSSDKDTTIVVRASDFDVEVLRLLNMVLPLKLKETFSCAARSLNDGLPLTVIGMAKEGSLGNSKRSTINWTPTSIADDCVYTESLAGFWPPGAEPPWQFIDRCRSFSIDLEAARVSGLDESFVRRKRLRYEIKKRGVRRKRHISWKFALIFLACAVLVCLGAGITIHAMHAKADKEKITFHVRDREKFFRQHSPEYSLCKYFPADENDRNKVIETCRSYLNDAERLRDQTNDQVLQAKLDEEIVKLKTLLDQLAAASKSYNSLRLYDQEASRLKTPTVYPSRSQVEYVLGLPQKITKVSLANLNRRYVSRIKKRVEDNTKQYRTGLGRLLDAKTSQVTQSVRSHLLQKLPTRYEAQTYKDYESLKQKLHDFAKNESLTNAKDSPIDAHLKIVKEVFQELGKGIGDSNDILRKMDGFKEKAEKSFNDANDILNDLNIADGRFENFDRLKMAWSHLDDVGRLWPKKPDLEKKAKEANDKFEKNKVEALRIWEEKTQKIKKDADPNAAPIKELLEQYDTEKIKLEGYKIQDINENLQQLKDFDQKLNKAYANLKSKQQANEESKSNGS